MKSSITYSERCTNCYSPLKPTYLSAAQSNALMLEDYLNSGSLNKEVSNDKQTSENITSGPSYVPHSTSSAKEPSKFLPPRNSRRELPGQVKDSLLQEASLGKRKSARNRYRKSKKARDLHEFVEDMDAEEEAELSDKSFKIATSAEELTDTNSEDDEPIN